MEKQDKQEENKASDVELLDFWAEWCGPCKVMKPIFDEIEEEYKDKLDIKQINVDEEEHRALVEQYNVMSIPTYIFRKNGEVVDQLIGAQPKEVVTQKIESLIAG